MGDRGRLEEQAINTFLTTGAALICVFMSIELVQLVGPTASWSRRSCPRLKTPLIDDADMVEA